MKINIRLTAIKEPEQIFKVSREFQTKTLVSKRTVEVADAFGLGVDEEKKFTVYRDFTVDINPGDVVYITGESGSGKSILLRELADKIESYPEFKGVVRDWTLEINPDEILVESVGSDTSEALNILSQAGLNEANLFLRRYRELSDGQKYRFKIAKMIDSKKGAWILDEFCSMLDRTTAKVVAYCMQKAARRLGKTLIAATAHTDLLEDLNPNLHIIKHWGADVEVKTYNPTPTECTLLKEVEIREASREELKKLEHLHYKAKTPDNITKIYAAYINNELAGAIAYTPPIFSCRGRNKTLPEYKPTKPFKEYLKRLNRDFTRIARVIVAPKYRSIGLGAKLVKETMPLMDKKYVETLAVMAKYNPFFEKAGMKKIEVEEDKEYQRFLTKLEALGFNIELLASKQQNLKTVNTLSEEQLKTLQKLILTNIFAEKFHEDKKLQEAVKRGDREAMAEALKHRRLNPTYLIWRNPLFLAASRQI
ncbi:MAG: GNAT family N-acetyltransferase [Nitrososphaerales archaeon]